MMKWFILIGLVAPAVWSQNLDKHQWQERVLVITYDKKNMKFAKQQLALFINEKEQLIDRNIILYSCFNNKYTVYNWDDTPEISIGNRTYSGFKTVLIGLDGGKKYTTRKVQMPEVFFNLIDKMPMRRQEIKDKNKGND